MNLNANEFFRSMDPREEEKETVEQLAAQMMQQEEAEAAEDEAHDHENDPRMRGIH